MHLFSYIKYSYLCSPDTIYQDTHRGALRGAGSEERLHEFRGQGGYQREGDRPHAALDNDYEGRGSRRCAGDKKLQETEASGDAGR